MNRFTESLYALALLLIMWGCRGNTPDNDIPRTHSVYITESLSDNTESTKYYTSSIEENKSVNSGFKTGGEIRRLTVNEGDYVRKGQVIGYLDDADYCLSVRQLEVQYNQMSSEMKRIEEMFKRNNIAPNDYEKARAGLEQIESQLGLARNKLEYTRLESPVSGYIVARYMEEGEMVGAGTPVYKIIDNSSLETSVALPSSIYSLRDEIVDCTGKSPLFGDIEIPLEIIGFVPDADNNSLFRLRLRISPEMNGRLLPGMNLSVRLRFRGNGDDRYCKVPSRSVFERNGKEYVWLVDQSDSTISAHEVSIIGVHNGKYSTVSGLSGNETIVTAGVHHLTDGEKVNVMGDINILEK